MSDLHEHHGMGHRLADSGPPQHRDGTSAHPGHGEHDGHASHDKHAGHSVAMFRDKFWISLLLTIPSLVWGHMLQNTFGFHAPIFRGSMHIPALFGTAVFA
jgi:Cu2+-exporting ATPase